MKKFICVLLILTLSLSILAGCGGKKAEEKPLREINVVLDWYPNALHSFLYTAIERGYFAEEGLDVKIQFPANENDALSLVSAGRAENGPNGGISLSQVLRSINLFIVPATVIGRSVSAYVSFITPSLKIGLELFINIPHY